MAKVCIHNLKESYRQGNSSVSIAEETGLPKSTVKEILAREGVERRSKQEAAILRWNGPENQAYIERRRIIEEVKMYYDQGYSERQVARLVGVKKSTVHKYLNQEGVERRTRDESIAVRLNNPEHEYNIMRQSVMNYILLQAVVDSLKRQSVVDSVKHYYSKGYSQQRIANMLRINQLAVYNFLIEEGVELRTKKESCVLRWNAPTSRDYLNRRKTTEAVLMYHSQNFLPSQIAAFTGLSVETVKRHIDRVIRKNIPTPGILIRLFPERYG